MQPQVGIQASYFGSEKATDRGITVVFVGYSLDRTSDCYRFWNPDKNSIIETCDAMFLNQMYFGRKDQTPMLEVEPEDEIVDAGDILAKDEGSDSDDEPDPPVTKTVTFADAIDTKVESTNADQAPALGTTSGAQSVPLSASQPQTILRSGRRSVIRPTFSSQRPIWSNVLCPEVRLLQLKLIIWLTCSSWTTKSWLQVK